MTAQVLNIYDEAVVALTAAGRRDLATRLRQERKREVSATLTSAQAAQILGVSSSNTVKNWLRGGFFPGAFRTAGGHWRFHRTEVLAVKQRLEDLRRRTASGDLMPPDDTELTPPLVPLL